LYGFVRSESRFDASVASSECTYGLVADGLHHAGDKLDDGTGDECCLKSLVKCKYDLGDMRPRDLEFVRELPLQFTGLVPSSNRDDVYRLEVRN
jgi:hypothetical protein